MRIEGVVQKVVSLRLKELRTSKGLSQKDISAYLKITREAYSLYEAGKRQMTYESLDSLADYYDVSVDFLLGRDEGLLLAEKETRLIKAYRELDARGKSSVDATLRHEHDLLRAEEKKQAT